MSMTKNALWMCVYGGFEGKRIGNSCFVDTTEQFENQLDQESAMEYCRSERGQLVNDSPVLDYFRAVRYPVLRRRRRNLVTFVCKLPSCSIGFFYLPECQKKCICKQLEYCEIRTGECRNDLCFPGFYGPPLCLSRCNCQDDVACDVNTGYCHFGCKKGWAGVDCSLRQCPSGYAVPPDCLHQCHCKDDEECDVNTGKCEHGCAIGWTGETCSERCTRVSCSGRCFCSDRSCEDPPGLCLCDPGWKGEFCSERKCPFGSFGPPNCTGTCFCENDRFCNPWNGDCMGSPCQENREGANCQEVGCPRGFFNPPSCKHACHCANRRPCDATTGECKAGCKEGWQGRHCNQRLCGQGRFLWPDCSHECHCNEAATCNSISGECESGGCLKGWTGRYCNTSSYQVLKGSYYRFHSPPSYIFIPFAGIFITMATVIALVDDKVADRQGQTTTEIDSDFNMVVVEGDNRAGDQNISVTISNRINTKSGMEQKSSEVKQLISYQITPKPPPEPLPFPLWFIITICCGGNMKYLVFPTLMAVSLGLFLAFTRAVSSSTAHMGYSPYQSPRELSEDEPDMSRSHNFFGNLLRDHASMIQARAQMMQQQRLQLPEPPQEAQQEDTQDCDCSRCEVDNSFLGDDTQKHRRLVKHSFQHFYGKQDLALQIEAFVPSKQKRWEMSPVFFIAAKEMCADGIAPLAVIVVHTHHRHMIERNVVRETWGSVAKGNNWPRRQLLGEIKLIFVLEVSDDPIDNDLATKESEQFNDIILVDIQETHKPASRKILSAFKWVLDYCPGTHYIIKVEEDSFIDLPILLGVLAYQDLTNMIFGAVVYAESVNRRTDDNKIMVSKKAYSPDWYPPYVKGACYVMPTTLAKRILEMAEYLPYVGVEDAFITGIVAKVFDARHVNIPDSLYDRSPNSRPELCDFVYRKKMVAHKVSPTLAHSIWRRVEKADMCGLYPAEE
ncbi:multiple epidermal growth factor-like domains 10 [Biomphalaria glabrata]